MEDNQNPSVKSDQKLDHSREDNSARARLIEAATKLFAEHGLEGTSTRDIAKAADLNISLISYYFGGKEGLYKAVIEEFAQKAKLETEKLLEVLDLENMTRENFKSGMHQLIRGMVPMKFSNREIHVLLMREVMGGLPHAREVYENTFSTILDKIVNIFVMGQKKGIVRKDIHPYVLFFAMVHSTDTYMQMSCCPSNVQGKILNIPQQMDEYIDQIFKIFVEGVLT